VRPVSGVPGIACVPIVAGATSARDPVVASVPFGTGVILLILTSDIGLMLPSIRLSDIGLTKSYR
jgi:hypothetical protein